MNCITIISHKGQRCGHDVSVHAGVPVGEGPHPGACDLCPCSVYTPKKPPFEASTEEEILDTKATTAVDESGQHFVLDSDRDEEIDSYKEHYRKHGVFPSVIPPDDGWVNVKMPEPDVDPAFNPDWDSDWVLKAGESMVSNIEQHERRAELIEDTRPSAESLYVQAGQPWQEELETEQWQTGPARVYESETDQSKTVTNWADSAMFSAQPIAAEDGPQVRLLWMTPDPLGVIAAACKGYKGEFVDSLSEVTDEEREHYFEQVQKTHLKAPFEFVQFHFAISGVTRAFTHQMVRQRTATFVQESLRFAVKEDMPVGLPPSLAGTKKRPPEFRHQGRDSDTQKQRDVWDRAQDRLKYAYSNLVESGMPAEDARGLLPTNILTRIQYSTDLRALIEHGGNRLCTQAQFEWRTVFAKIVEAIRTHDAWSNAYVSDNYDAEAANDRDRWQFTKLADVFRPVCYLTGKCEFNSEFDRPCSIRDRVQANHAIGRPSAEWHTEKNLGMPVWRQNGPAIPWGRKTKNGIEDIIPAIAPIEWLADPKAAR